MSDSTTPAGRVNGLGHDIPASCAENAAHPPATIHDAPPETPGGQAGKTSRERIEQLKLKHLQMVFTIKVMAFLTAVFLLMAPVLGIVKVIVDLAAKAASHYLGF